MSALITSKQKIVKIIDLKNVENPKRSFAWAVEKII